MSRSVAQAETRIRHAAVWAPRTGRKSNGTTSEENHSRDPECLISGRFYTEKP